MSLARRTVRTAVLCTLLAGALASAAAARPIDDPQTAAALSQERYYSSYGDAEPLTLPQEPAPSDPFPWAPVSLSIVAALGIAAASTTHLLRLRVRRRAARVPESLAG